jgi:tetratricopeptide (TPR) repeat protein
MLWKITDFGTSAEATSKKSLQTSLRRGTASYRAPEVLSDTASYTNKVDIWALGCIAFELASGRKAFSGDWDVRKHALEPSSKPPQILSMWPKFMQHQFQDIVVELLQVEYPNRPSSTQLASKLRVSLDWIDSVDANELQLTDAVVGSSRCLADWKAFVLEYPESRSLSSQFTIIFDNPEWQGIDAVEGWWSIVSNYPSQLKLLEELQAVYNRHGDQGLSVSGWRKLYEMYPMLDDIRSNLEMACHEAKDYHTLASILEQLKETAVPNWETYFDLAEAYEKSGDWAKAFKYLQQVEILSPFSPVLRMSKVLNEINAPEIAAGTWKDMLLRRPIEALPGKIEENLHRAYRELGMLHVALEGWTAIRNKHPNVQRFQGYVAVLTDAKSRDILRKMPIQDRETSDSHQRTYGHLTNDDQSYTDSVSGAAMEVDDELLNLEMLVKDSHNLELQAELAATYAAKRMEVEALAMWQKIIKGRPYRSGFKTKLLAALETVKGDEGTRSRKEVMKSRTVGKSRFRGIWELLKGVRTRYALDPVTC